MLAFAQTWGKGKGLRAKGEKKFNLSMSYDANTLGFNL